MAKKSKIAKNEQRRVIVARYAERRRKGGHDLLCAATKSLEMYAQIDVRVAAHTSPRRASLAFTARYRVALATARSASSVSSAPRQSAVSANSGSTHSA